MLIVRKAKKKIVRPDGMHDAWIYQSPALPVVEFDKIVQDCSESCGENPSKTVGVVTALINRISNLLSIGRAVEIEGIGTLKPVINSKAADTAEGLGDPTTAIKGIKIRFYPHKPLQEAIAENGYEYQEDLDDK